ncbi:hypothetical protein KU6B_39300 [Mameliella alba]|nr:hypothetical protein KU6B_39300 [Mameliella alba]
MTDLPVLILGARSDMGQAIAHAFAAQGHPIQLAARNAAGLDAVRADLALRHGVEVTLHDFDVLDSDGFAPFLDSLPALPQVAVSVVGYMGEQAENEQDLDKASLVLRSNFEGPAGILALLANRFEARGSGTLVGVSSVAGDRGGPPTMSTVPPRPVSLPFCRACATDWPRRACMWSPCCRVLSTPR